MLSYALIDGVKSRPLPKARGVCPACYGDVLAKCGSIKAHHWAHASGQECDSWSEGIGPWHLDWQSCVRPEFIEVPIGPHRADIVGENGIVIELQHSPISPESIGEREAFYGNMIWLIDATGRFGGFVSGKRFFFSFGHTRHLDACRKPMVLDFQDFLVEVEAVTDLIAGFSGFGLIHDRNWFVDKHLASCRSAGPLSPRSKRTANLNTGAGTTTRHLTMSGSQWLDPALGIRVSYAAGTQYLPVTGPGTGDWPVWWDIIARHPSLANGWTQGEMRTMENLFSGTPLILDGYLRLMPGFGANVKASVGQDMMIELLAVAEKHMQAGRIPLLSDRLRVQMLEQAGLINETKVGHFLSKMANTRGHRRWLTGRR